MTPAKMRITRFTKGMLNLPLLHCQLQVLFLENEITMEHEVSVGLGLPQSKLDPPNKTTIQAREDGVRKVIWNWSANVIKPNGSSAVGTMVVNFRVHDFQNAITMTIVSTALRIRILPSTIQRGVLDLLKTNNTLHSWSTRCKGPLEGLCLLADATHEIQIELLLFLLKLNLFWDVDLLNLFKTFNQVDGIVSRHVKVDGDVDGTRRGTS